MGPSPPKSWSKAEGVGWRAMFPRHQMSILFQQASADFGFHVNAQTHLGLAVNQADGVFVIIPLPKRFHSDHKGHEGIAGHKCREPFNV